MNPALIVFVAMASTCLAIPSPCAHSAIGSMSFVRVKRQAFGEFDNVAPDVGSFDDDVPSLDEDEQEKPLKIWKSIGDDEIHDEILDAAKFALDTFNETRDIAKSVKTDLEQKFRDTHAWHTVVVKGFERMQYALSHDVDSRSSGNVMIFTLGENTFFVFKKGGDALFQLTETGGHSTLEDEVEFEEQALSTSIRLDSDFMSNEEMKLFATVAATQALERFNLSSDRGEICAFIKSRMDRTYRPESMYCWQ